MSLFATVLPLADIEDFIGIVFFLVTALISYCFDYLKKQKAEAAARRTMQKEFREKARHSVSAPPLPSAHHTRTTAYNKTVVPVQKIPVERTMPDVEDEARRRMLSRAKKNSLPSCMRPHDNIELSLSDAELDAIKAFQSGEPLQPSAPVLGRKQQTTSPNESFCSQKLNVATLRQAVIYKEILDKPRALREYTWK